jgi:hypothetical protein
MDTSRANDEKLTPNMPIKTRGTAKLRMTISNTGMSPPLKDRLEAYTLLERAVFSKR